MNADECVDARAIDQLRRRGPDILTAADLGLLGASDEAHLSRAIDLGRVLLSSDHDFLALVREFQRTGRTFPGLILIQPHATTGDIVRGVMLCWAVLEASDMEHRIEWVPY
jgi:predicted nuclease of predicted toxin-antitoxin system